MNDNSLKAISTFIIHKLKFHTDNFFINVFLSA